MIESSSHNILKENEEFRKRVRLGSKSVTGPLPGSQSVQVSTKWHQSSIGSLYMHPHYKHIENQLNNYNDRTVNIIKGIA